MIKITIEYIQAHKTENGSWTKAQIFALGLSYPLKNGWQKRLVGQELSDEQAKLFEEGKHQFEKRSKGKSYSKKLALKLKNKDLNYETSYRVCRLSNNQISTFF